MKEIHGDILKLIETGKYDAFCVTTNGYVKSNGECVMGRGIAYRAKTRWPNLPYVLGNKIRKYGNHVHPLGLIQKTNTYILSFPTKHNWWETSDIELIKCSCTELMKMANKLKLNNIIIPRPGCGNGNLLWEAVKPAIEPLLDDRITVATF